MWVLGITGGIASGKTRVAELFAKRGIIIIDTDQIAREVAAPGTPLLAEIQTRFPEAMHADGTLNRVKLRDIIFNDKTARQWLESRMHPLIRQLALERALRATSPYCIIVIPLLTETNADYHLNRILLVDTPEVLQLKRLMLRERINKETAQKILEAQATRQKRLRKADDVIHNTGSLIELEEAVHVLHLEYLNKAKGHV